MIIIFLLSASFIITIMYMAISLSFKGNPSVLSLHYIIPPIIFFINFIVIFYYLSSHLIGSFTMQFIAFIISILATIKISHLLGKITGNGFDKEAEKMIDNILEPFEIVRNIWNNIKFALKQIWNAIVNFFRDIVYTPLDAIVSAGNIIMEAVVDIANAFFELWGAFFGIFVQIGDILNNIISVGGSIPRSKLPPMPPLPPIPK